MYGYKCKQHIKLYRPLSTPRFRNGGSLGENYCFGLEQPPAKGDTLFITGGEKDVLSLAAHGFHAICFNSETVTIPPTLVSVSYTHLIFPEHSLFRKDICLKEELLNQAKEKYVRFLTH